MHTVVLSTLVLFGLVWSKAWCETPTKRFAALSDELIDYINNKPGGTWKAGKTTRFKSIDEVKQLLGALPEPKQLRNSRRPTVTHVDKQINLPASFNASTNWPNCPGIKLIRDQSNCGSCWAFGAVSAMSDRLCIHSHGAIQVELSAVDLLSCCHDCGFGCEGGWVGPTWDYWVHSGLVTGGSKEDHSGCRPYPFPHCEHHTNGSYGPCPSKRFSTPKCVQECVPDYAKMYYEDKFFAKTSYNLLHNEETIMKEIMINGPVEASINVYEDLPNYRSGVYKHTTGALIGGHAIRVVGWGTENGEKFWLVANSWNDHWGDYGYFRILRGTNECGIESGVSAGLPLV
ncbi:cathepsin B [Fasciola gigantica]|uniref:Cathepsin B-like cysteine proteinase n=1 Tax=Fasciola gigantica TaxID=46835 RepID=A0A504Y8C0_FASGI|nr:cathepsin B [Fasciola gigantica]